MEPTRLGFPRLIARDRLTGLALGVLGGGILVVVIGLVTAVVDRRARLAFVALGGLPVAALGALLLRSRVRAVRRALAGVRTPATVTSVFSFGSKVRLSYRFEVDGRPVLCTETTWLDPIPVVGGTVEVAYDPDDPGCTVVLAVLPSPSPPLP